MWARTEREEGDRERGSRSGRETHVRERAKERERKESDFASVASFIRIRIELRARVCAGVC